MKTGIGTALVLLAAVGCSGAPREKPVLEPPALPLSPGDIVGAWHSVSLKGPGSASYRSMDLILHGDGRFDFVGEAVDGGRVMLGRYTWTDGTLTLVRRDGTTLKFGCRREGSTLLLTDRGAELRLTAVRS